MPPEAGAAIRTLLCGKWACALQIYGPLSSRTLAESSALGGTQIKMCAVRAVIKFNRQFIQVGGSRAGEGRRGVPTAVESFCHGVSIWKERHRPGPASVNEIFISIGRGYSITPGPEREQPVAPSIKNNAQPSPRHVNLTHYYANGREEAVNKTQNNPVFY